jgi:hypothetical protein
MARTLSIATAAAVAEAGTAPAYLVQIGWSTVSRLTTADTVLDWGGYLWLPGPVTLSGLTWSNSGLQTARLELGNADQAFSALALNEGVSDISIVVYAYDRGAVAAGDPVKVFDGVGGRLSADDDSVSIELVTQRSRALKSPRQRITRAGGYSLLPAPGTVVRWGNERYILRRKRDG